MIKQFVDAVQIPPLRKRILFTLFCLAIYRFGAAVPTPGINAQALASIFSAQQGSLLGFMDIFTGGALGRFSIFSMGVMPYINASIIMGLLQGAHVIPYLDRLAREGEMGRRKINQYTRYLTLFLGSFQSFGLTVAISSMPTPGGVPVVDNPTPAFYLTTVLTLTAGTLFIMWLGELMTEQGVGNGISLIIFAGIVEGLPSALKGVIGLISVDEMNVLQALLLGGALLAVLVAVVWVETGIRRIPVQYAQRMVGRRSAGGMQSHLPLKVDQSGVIAVIFAVSLLAVPLTIVQFNPTASFSQTIQRWVSPSNYYYQAVYAGLIIFFCYFYNSVSINPTDLAENMKKSGGFIPGIRPGEPTANYITWVLERITLGGALFVAAIAVLPELLRSKYAIPFFFGGTSLLIVVGVALDTMGQLEAHLIMRHYQGFGGSAKSRIRGRWFNIGG